MTPALLLEIEMHVIPLTVVASQTDTHTRLTFRKLPFPKLPTEITAWCFEAKQVISLQSCTQDKGVKNPERYPHNRVYHRRNSRRRCMRGNATGCL